MYAEVSPAIVGSPKTIFSGHKCQTASGSLLRECRDRGTTFRLVVKMALDLGGPAASAYSVTIGAVALRFARFRIHT